MNRVVYICHCKKGRLPLFVRLSFLVSKQSGLSIQLSFSAQRAMKTTMFILCCSREFPEALEAVVLKNFSWKSLRPPNIPSPFPCQTKASVARVPNSCVPLYTHSYFVRIPNFSLSPNILKLISYFLILSLRIFSYYS